MSKPDSSIFSDGRMYAHEWQEIFVDALETELKERLVTLALQEWEWVVLVEALKAASDAVNSAQSKINN